MRTSNMNMSRINGVLDFWLDEVGPKNWYAVDADLDRRIRERFQCAWEKARRGGCAQWLTHPGGALACIILLDQFSRNMFRTQAAAFASDRTALAITKQAIYRRLDWSIEEPARQFFYLPLMHSESLCDQDRCVRLIKERLPQSGTTSLLHARAHREVIRAFGRFPYRNPVLGRTSTQAETAYLARGGYAFTLQRLQDTDNPR